MDFLSDTTFVIDLWRERSAPGPALRFVDDHLNAVVGMPWVVKGEFLRGAWLAGHAHDSVESFLDSFLVVWPTERTLRIYAGLYAELRKENALIGPNDLWIAATAIEHSLPLLTRNASEFARVEELKLTNYGG